MNSETETYPDEMPRRINGEQLKLGIAVLIGAALGLGVYFLVLNNSGAPNINPGVNGGVGNQPSSFCVCRQCGTRVERPAGIDCEELNCPNCGTPMVTGVTLAAAAAAPMGAGTMTQNQRETLAEQGIVAPGPINQNQRETLAEQGIATPTRPQGNPFPPPPVPQPVAVTTLPAMGTPGMCICPNCGNRTTRPAGMACGNMGCPLCQNRMTNAIPVGLQNAPTPFPNSPQPVVNNPVNGYPLQVNPAAPYWATPNGSMAPAPQPIAAAAPPTPPCPHMAAPTQAPQCPGAAGANTMATPSPAITYSNTIQGIISKNCLGCHGGPIRNLEAYASVKNYADNGLLVMMTQPGGPMSRFLTAHEFQQIKTWVDGGAQR